MPGSSILLKDSILAVDKVLSDTLKIGPPRHEALLLLGSLLCLPDQYTCVPVLDDGVEGCMSDGMDAVKLKIIELLYRSAKTESFRNSRCLAIFQVGLLLFIELQANRESPIIPEGIDILLATLQVRLMVQYLVCCWKCCALLELNVVGMCTYTPLVVPM